MYTVSAIAGDGTQRLTRIELDTTKPINFADYGGPHFELYVTGADTGLINITTVDYTQTIAVAKTRIDSVQYNAYVNTTTVTGANWIDTKYPTTSRQVEKKNGVPFSGSNHDMYFLYLEPSTGIKIYFLDDVSRMNCNDVVIEMPNYAVSATPTPSVARLIEPQSNPIPKTLNNDAPISPELYSWYVKLVKERETLDVSNHEAVAQFNKHVAAYVNALTTARQNMTAQ
ncbi:MAG: hypothetical protein WCD79_04335 [Chthoniobacteraceae bacterium]